MRWDHSSVDKNNCVMVHLERFHNNKMICRQYEAERNLNVIIYEDEIFVSTDRRRYSIEKLEEGDAVIIYVGSDIAEIITVENQQIKNRKPRMRLMSYGQEGA